MLVHFLFEDSHLPTHTQIEVFLIRLDSLLDVVPLGGLSVHREVVEGERLGLHELLGSQVMAVVHSNLTLLIHLLYEERDTVFCKGRVSPVNLCAEFFRIKLIEEGKGVLQVSLSACAHLRLEVVELLGLSLGAVGVFRNSRSNQRIIGLQVRFVL